MNKMISAENAPFAISSGDPAGIGPEIIYKSWQHRKEHNLPPFFAIGDAKVFESFAPVKIISKPHEAVDNFDAALPIVHIGDSGDNNFGTPSKAGAHIAYEALKRATAYVQDGQASAIITAPVSKKQLYDVGFTHAGQTEFIAEMCGVTTNNAIMMLAGPSLRVVPITTHIALNAVSNSLNRELIEKSIIGTHQGLIKSFAIENPIIAIAGLNPHAGENGSMGHEEIKLLSPIIAELQNKGYNIIGPLPADTMFHAEARAQYDVAMCCYHDQALIPLKTLYFHEAVNLTLGLPIIRTSPDHGTAFNIAGKNIARPDSMIAAIKMASYIAKNRQIYEQNIIR